MGRSRGHRLVTPERAARNFRRALVEGRGTQRWDGDVEGQSLRYQMARAEADLQATTVKSWAYARGVPMCSVVAWLNFARHIGRQQKHYSGATLALMARLAVERWAKYGLDRAMLESLCYDIYNVTVAGTDREAAGPGQEPRAPGDVG
jgi:hypothetical protein